MINFRTFLLNIFLRLLRFVYNIDERKFRGAVQGGADQDTKRLEIIAQNGPVAQLVRAPRWHRGGRRFEPDQVHS